MRPKTEDDESPAFDFPLLWSALNILNSPATRFELFLLNDEKGEKKITEKQYAGKYFQADTFLARSHVLIWGF
jgi:hypothetical protein